MAPMGDDAQSVMQKDRPHGRVTIFPLRQWHEGRILPAVAAEPERRYGRVGGRFYGTISGRMVTVPVSAPTQNSTSVQALRNW